MSLIHILSVNHIFFQAIASLHYYLCKAVLYIPYRLPFYLPWPHDPLESHIIRFSWYTFFNPLCTLFMAIRSHVCLIHSLHSLIRWLTCHQQPVPSQKELSFELRGLVYRYCQDLTSPSFPYLRRDIHKTVCACGGGGLIHLLLRTELYHQQCHTPILAKHAVQVEHSIQLVNKWIFVM